MAERNNVSVAVVAEKRSHVIKIDGYSRAKSLLKNGQCVKSNPFIVGGHQWVVSYSNSWLAPDYIFVFLHIISADAKDEVRAKARFSVLDKDGAPVRSSAYNLTTTEHVFRAACDQLLLRIIKHRNLEESGHLRDDCFLIRCDITVFKDPIHKGHQFVEVPPSNLDQHLGDLLSSADGADVTFHVGGEKISAHRLVLAARSSVFKAELLGAMKENSGNPIKIDDMEPCVFKSLLSFIYTDSLPQMTQEMASHLLVAADRYNIKRLKLICEDKLCNHIDVEMVATSLVLAEQHSCPGLKEACLQFLVSPSNLVAMVASDGYQHLKSSCPAVLRELIARLLPIELKVAKDIVMAI